ncbi:MAG: multi-sensor signal transduction histidine kinase [Candidatus Solibacter sp.]|nr:multi-sensor signal transduction histidine kinase [Candidatus Solibacter sp.]
MLASASAGILVDWRAPGIDRYTRDWLMRLRGPQPVPDDIAIVAIDEPSMLRYGRFPWSRQVIARTIDALAAAHPKVIALDVLFTDPTTQEDDESLSRSIGRAGNVVVASQLTDSPVHGGPSRWLLPLSSIERAAAAVGHVNVQTELEGIARQISVRLADDSGRSFRAMAIEAVRVADGTAEEGVTDTQNALLLGSRTILLGSSPRDAVVEPSQSTRVLRGGRMAIDYVGPAGSFNPVTYSLADVVAGRVLPEKFRGKFVLIGATAASLGDRVSSPFVRYSDARADQHGALMPGVEVLANTLNVILRSRYYSETSDMAAFLWAAVVALLTLILLEVAQGGPELLKQLAVLIGIAALVMVAGYVAFLKLLIFPPLVPCLVAFGCAGVLGLLQRSLTASARLDSNIAELALSGDLLAPAGPGIPGPYHWAKGGPVSLSRGWLPRGLEWKARMLSELNARLLDRAKFINFALRSIEDGLLIADSDGMITFANRSAGAILGAPSRGLVGQNLAHRLNGAVDGETLARLIAERGHIEREITIRGLRQRQYTLRLAAVSADEKGEGPVLGIVGSLSDVTRQHELQQTKNDVISLVSHEMRTPLTAIQGMTELLAAYDVEPGRRREMNLAINDEVKRLASMITEYLNITRLESGATEMRLAPVRVETVLDRILILLGPVAGQRQIQLTRDISPDLPAVLADLDLISRAAENLVSNAIKYSPNGTTVTVAARADEEALFIEVSDQGYGVPESDLARIFEKFYRVPRVQDAGVPGTGLGLSLVREIAELHRGSVSVRSEVGRGSTFTLRIPRTEAT